MPVVHLTTSTDVESLVTELFEPARALPIVVVTTRNGETVPLIDVDALAGALDREPAVLGVTVRLLPTGPLTWDLTGLLPERLGVFGGAARIWWPGLSPDDPPYRHPLVFAYSPEEGARALERLLAELRRRPQHSLTDHAPARTRAIEVPRLRSTPPALPVGDVVRGVVVETAAGGAEIEVSPGSRGWLVRRRRDPELEVGAEVAVRIAGYDGAVPLLERPPRSTAPPQPVDAPSPPHAERPTVAVLPGPHLFRRSVGVASQPDGASAQGPADEVPPTAPDVELVSLRVALERALAQVDQLTHDLKDTEDDLRQAQHRAEAAEGELGRANRDTKRQVRELKAEAKRGKDRERWLQAELHGTGRYDDADEQFRWEVELAWQRMLTEGERATEPLAPYRLGASFLPTLASLQGVPREKVVEVCVEVLTNRAKDNPSRELHHLRASAGGDSPDRVRPDDNAQAFRVSLQVKTASARRLHFWRLPDGTVELANVLVHDDFSID